MHVLGRRHGTLVKNAVDVKMAVDAVSFISSLPHIDVYVIVSGDRDFIHVLKELRRHGKTVIGVSPNSAVSKDFSGLCDRFIRYEALTSTAEPIEAESIDEVRSKLAGILRDNPDGMFGSAVKPMLRRVLSSTFDESTIRVQELFRVPRRDERHRESRPSPGKRRGRPARISRQRECARPARTPTRRDRRPGPTGQTAQAPLRAHRRETLSKLFACMTGHGHPFTLLGLHESMRDSAGNAAMPLTNLMKYARIMFMGRAFAIEPGQDDVVLRERDLSLAEGIRAPEDLVLCYENAGETVADIGFRNRLSPRAGSTTVKLQANFGTSHQCASR